MPLFPPRSRLLPAFILAALALLIAIPVSARETREIGDGITVEIGFITEPPIQNDTNGLWLYVSSGDDPVEGLESGLSTQVSFAGETRELPLTPVPGEPGTYTSMLIPTQPGEYGFQITGTIGDLAIDETFTADPNGIPLVASRLDYEFPTAAHGNITNLAWPAGAAVVMMGVAGYLLRRQHHQSSAM
ncbi:MAG TPA: hypothetical protein VNZ58_08935 [Thermomicrobiales bacterium]|nr:hypothetical protein [Thermomicrobiales bacterium]